MKNRSQLTIRSAGAVCAALALFAASSTARADVMSLTLTEESSSVLTASAGWTVVPLAPDHWQVLATSPDAVTYLQSFPPLPVAPPEPASEGPFMFNLVTKVNPVMLDVLSDVPGNQILLPDTAPAVFQFTFIDEGDAPTTNNVPDASSSAFCLALGVLPLLALKNRKAVQQ